MSEWQRSGYEPEQGASELQVVRHCQLSHDDAADFGARVSLVFSEFHSFTSVGLAAEDSSLKQWEKGSELGLLTTLVKIFKQCQHVLHFQQTLFHALACEAKKA